MTIKKISDLMANKTNSIYKNLLFGSMFALLIGLIFSSIFSYSSTRHEVDELFDAQLLENARLFKGILSQATEQKDWQIVQKSLYATMPDAPHQLGHLRKSHSYEKKLMVQVWSPDGVLRLSSAQTDQPMPLPNKSGFDYFDDGQYRWRIYSAWLNESQSWLVVAERTDIRQELSQNIEFSIVSGLILALLFSLWWLRKTFRAGFRPLLDLGAAIANRHLDDLNPIQIEKNPLELVLVLEELNQLFARVSAARQRERDFLADAAHELRTPLAVIRLQVQQALQLPAEQQTLILQKLLDSVQRNQQVIEHMLLLARLEGDEQTVAPEKIYLSALIRETVAQMIPLALKYAVELQVNSVEADIIGDAALCMAMLRNLIDNALRHAPENSVIEIELKIEHQNLILSVCDQGAGIPSAELDRITQRFQQYQRADQAGSGLGLAIVRQVCQRHHAKLVLHNHDGGGLCARVMWSSYTAR